MRETVTVGAHTFTVTTTQVYGDQNKRQIIVQAPKTDSKIKAIIEGVLKTDQFKVASKVNEVSLRDVTTFAFHLTGDETVDKTIVDALAKASASDSAPTLHRENSDTAPPLKRKDTGIYDGKENHKKP